MEDVMSKQYAAEFKKKVVLEVLRGERTINELAIKFNLHPDMIRRWKNEAIEGIAQTFSKKTDKKNVALQERVDYMEKKIGQLVLEIDFIKKNSSMFQ
jgi:transposase-like protein